MRKKTPKRPNYAALITKEELVLLPQARFPGKIEIIETKKALREALKVLRRSDAIGLDTETKASFSAGKRNEVSLLQLSTDEICYLIRLNRIGFTDELIRLMENPKVLKIGLSLKDDRTALRRLASFEPESFVELQKLCPGYGLRVESLQKIYGIIFGEYMSKGQRMSNWEASELSTAQQAYAALDAWACLRIYRRLMEHDAPNPTQFAILH